MGLHEGMERRHLQSDSGHLEIPAVLQGAGQEFRLNRARISDQHVHCFGFDRSSFSGSLGGTVGFHAAIMPQKSMDRL